MPKDQVLNTRISTRDLDVLKRAAELEGMSTSAFVTRAALRDAELLLARSDRTVMPAETFASVMASLDVPDAAPRLSEAFARHGS
ncbi:DUF1778 domain-containing protein [Demequina sp. TTPB684]|uniref:type II toxin-antitoxin system TacA family antitoxin n=1 Tax=unclassified Demequina TaxID=2620311 RepID=UPI001CF2D845|nr:MULTISPECIES: DUF1778 domain-containing protein [unclassified Demequina]MCB2412793.1 DUF1778 domain-containing protein [Demequina sp. TTPB684]UPU87140.1 DUF1778 domain-containing protein [Demequina sp. TMPB413]